ncbi:MAG: hypothetical protein KGY76_05915 [Candidatus Thermoplasmatota archaeon]|nr:hypothetical protein [Candidatus Thermoplasmatota archaeon]
MDFKVLEKTDTTVELEIKDADDTVMYPLIEQLLKEGKVISADYSVKHQELDNPILEVEVEEDADPKEELVNISRSFKDDIEEIYSDIYEEEEN